MAFTPPVDCPICGDTLELDRTLEEHLIRSHTHREAARYIVSLRKWVERGRVSD
jgi:hypothetical protein